MSEQLQRDLGRHDAKIEALEIRVAAVEKKIDTVLEILNQAKGGWKTIVMVGGAAGAIGALLGKLLPLVKWG